MKSMLKNRYVFLFFLTFWLSVGFWNSVWAQAFSARSAVEKTEVFVGEPFLFQIQVEGSDAPSPPNLTEIQDFTIQERGGQNNSNTSITVINGKLTQQVRRGYTYSYQLTPKKEGSFVIPSLSISAAGKTATTQPIRIRVKRPSETGDFKLRMELSSNKAYVGQPITLTITWYIGKNVEDFQFGLPVFSDNRFEMADVELKIDPNQQDHYLRIPTEGGEIIARKDQGTLEGKNYLTIRFQKILIPKQTGTLTIPQSTVAFNAVMGYQQRSQPRRPFGSFFNSPLDDFFKNDPFFGNSRQAIHQKFVIPSNEPVLTVLNLPNTGQPDNFTGLVGKYQIVARAVPTAVRVGDPITLTLQITGAETLKNITLPSLNHNTMLARDFKIPQEMAPGKIEDGVITFTQTLRAQHPDVQSIPPIELPYFDVEQGKYVIARTEPIPLSVTATRVVTVQDAEGLKVSEQVKTELETLSEGIAYNYEDLSVLKNQASGLTMWIHSPLWITLVSAPPLLYLFLFSLNGFLHWRQANPEGKKRQRAYGELIKILKRVQNSEDNPGEGYTIVLEAFRKYLGSKLQLASSALVYHDVKDILQNKGVEEEILESLKSLFTEVEAQRFAGSSAAGGDLSMFVDRAIILAKNLERRIG